VSQENVPLGATLSNPYNGMATVPFPYQGTYTTGGGIFAVSTAFKWAYTYQTNVGVQREIGKLMLGAAYIGTFNRNLPFGRDVNYPAARADAATSNVLSRRPNTAFGAVTLLDSDQDSAYNGLQITASMRPWHGVSFSSFYTLSQTMSSVQLMNNTTQGLAQNYTKMEDEYGRADTDQRHVFSMSVNWEINYYRGGNGVLGHILNGWNIAPIVKLRSGLPFTVTNNNVDANLDGVGTTDRAQLVGDPHLDHPTAGQWFNTAAFAQNRAQVGNPVDGNSTRNFLEGPGFRVVDLAVSRDFQLPGKAKLSVRAEATNAFNIVSLGQPGTGVTSGTFGVIRTANPMRRTQLGVRVTF